MELHKRRGESHPRWGRGRSDSQRVLPARFCYYRQKTHPTPLPFLPPEEFKLTKSTRKPSGVPLAINGALPSMDCAPFFSTFPRFPNTVKSAQGPYFLLDFWVLSRNGRNSDRGEGWLSWVPARHLLCSSSFYSPLICLLHRHFSTTTRKEFARKVQPSSQFRPKALQYLVPGYRTPQCCRESLNFNG